MRKLSYIGVDDAIEKLVNMVKKRMASEEISPEDAYGRILAESIVSTSDVPPRDISHFDGYAVRSEDVSSASREKLVSLKIKGEIRLGDTVSYTLESGETYKVFTGSFLPKNSDAVVMKERVKYEDDMVMLHLPLAKGENIVPAGRDVSAGETVLNSGHRVRAQDLGLFEILNIACVKVVQKPKVAILSVGDELIEQPKRIGKTATSHARVITKLVEEAGGTSEILEIAPDDAPKICLRIKEGLAVADVLMTIGGASIGERDFIADAINSLGKPGIVFHGLKISPGRVAGFGIIDEKPVIILPGLIQSTYVGFRVLVLPLIRIISGVNQIDSQYLLKAQLQSSVHYKKFLPFRKVTFVKISKMKGKFLAEPITGISSMISVLVKADGFIIVPENIAFLENGKEVEIYLFPFLQ